MGIPEDIKLFEKRLDDLILKYEQYFLGLERREPLKLLEEVEKLSRKYSGNNLINTQLTFKYNSLKSRLASYKQYWGRITRLMDEGKYSRDRFKMDINEKLPVAAPTGEKTGAEQETESIYLQFLQARRECNLPVEKITRQMVADIVTKYKHLALAKYKCPDVELRITVENGNPKLKIRPKK